MKVFGVIKDIWLRACSVFTVVCLCFYSIGMLINDSGSFMVPRLSTLFLMLAFSLVLSSMKYVLTSKKLHPAVKYLIHFTVTAAAFIIIFLISSGAAASPPSALVAVIIYVVLYIVCSAAAFFIRFAARERKLDSAEYKNQFDKLKK